MLADGQGTPEEKEVTHALVDEDGVVWGGFCAAYAPVIMLWLTSQRVSRQATLAKYRAIVAVEQFYANLGHTRLLLTLHRDSALYSFAGRAGYQLLGACELFAKDLNHPNPLKNERIIFQAQDASS